MPRRANFALRARPTKRVSLREPSCNSYVLAVTDQERIRELELSNAELRTALILAGRELKKRAIGRRDSQLLKLLRRTLRNARQVAKRSAGASTLPGLPGSG